MSFPSEQSNIECQIDEYNKCLEGHALALKGEAHSDNILLPHEIENIKNMLEQLTNKLNEQKHMYDIKCKFIKLPNTIININIYTIINTL